MFKKDKKIFHLQEESVRKEQKEKRFLWISLAVILVFSVAAVFFVLKKNDFKIHYFFDPSAKTTASPESTSEENALPVTPEVSGKTNFLFLGVDEKGVSLQYVLLVQSDLDLKTFKVCALPTMTMGTAGTRSDTLQGQLSYGGPKQVTAAVSALIGQPVARYVMVRSDNFERIGRKLGTISYTVPEAINVLGTDADLKLSAGEQSLTPSTVLKLMQYPFGGNLQKQLKVQSGLAVSALDQLLNPTNVAKAEELFGEIVNLVDTDISVADFTKSQDALRALSSVANRPSSVAVAVSGSTKNGAFVLSGDSIAALKEGFQLRGQE